MPGESEVDHVVHHKDGSVWARGKLIGDTPSGYWEWFRKDGTKLRSGYFEKGEQTGEWTTYDQKGKVYKVTRMKAKVKKSGNSRSFSSQERHEAPRDCVKR